MELLVEMMNILRDVPDEPSIIETGSGTSVAMIVGVAAAAAALIFVLFAKKPKA